ncbi:MAG: Pr6Pr family membrane protein, partial [Ktedonobacteraceae bacterium]|nr:Pr6Pr family membrane protein [Ktedonobacteraceae bacterium]
FVRLLYFTIQSNLLLALCIAYAAWATLRNLPGPAPLLKGAVTVYITITCLVYNLILAKAAGSSPPTPGTIIVPLLGGTLSNDLLHIIAPLMAVLDWLLFDAHGHLRWRYPLRWLAYPLAYLAFVLIRGVLISGPFQYPYLHYPYPFLNVDKIGYSGVALNTLIYGIAFWLIGLAFVIGDQLLARFNLNRNNRPTE